jgi:UDP-galactopyranose mutase
MTVDAIVAGAGIWGCTIARRLAEAGRKVLVLEKRPVTGGNVRCEKDGETGIEVHSYGSHIFHTHIPEVWDFVNRFIRFNGYQHKVLANYKGKIYYLPLGLAMINKYFGVELKPGEVADFMADESRSRAIFDAFFRGYTSKQWGKPPEEIDPSIIKRVPVRSNYDVNYFNDYNQGIPLTGYNSLFERLLDHTGIEVRCNAGIRLEGNVLKAGGDDLPNVPVYYSGPIDELFGYRFGHLPWRTLRFETEKLAVKDYQGTSVVNYTEAEIPYTRIHEFKHYHPEDQAVMNSPKTIIMREYSAAWKPGDEPYYPVDNADSRDLLARYQAEAARVPNLVIGGRLGGYKYYDMDKSISAALSLSF